MRDNTLSIVHMYLRTHVQQHLDVDAHADAHACEQLETQTKLSEWSQACVVER
jgi:hypothetical protein